MVAFRIDPRNGLPTYLQLVQQVKRALLLGTLRAGDQLPTVKDVVGRTAVNPNTVLKAYRELEREGLVEGRPGVGTFVTADSRPLREEHAVLLRELQAWIGRARRAGLSLEAIAAIFHDGLQAEEATA